MKWLQHLVTLSFATSSSLAADSKATSAFISSRRGDNVQLQHDKPATIVRTAAEYASAMNSIAFMNALCGRKNTADVRTFTQPITASMGREHIRINDSNESSRLETQDVSKDDDDTTLPTWTLLNVFFRKEEQHCPVEIITTPKSNKNKNTHTTANSNIHSHETVAEYIGKLWFLPKDKGTIKFRETIRIISLGLDGETSTVECHTQYYNGSDWVDCSKVLCHFSSLSTTSYRDLSSNVNGNDASSLKEKVKMTLDCELLVWLPLPALASRAVRKKIGSVFEEIVIDFFDELAMV